MRAGIAWTWSRTANGGGERRFSEHEDSTRGYTTEGPAPVIRSSGRNRRALDAIREREPRPSRVIELISFFPENPEEEDHSRAHVRSI